MARGSPGELDSGQGEGKLWRRGSRVNLHLYVTVEVSKQAGGWSKEQNPEG